MLLVKVLDLEMDEGVLLVEVGACLAGELRIILGGIGPTASATASAPPKAIGAWTSGSSSLAPRIPPTRPSGMSISYSFE